jgi:hypothetical protein
MLKTQVVQRWKLSRKLTGECQVKLIFRVLIYSNTYRTLYAMTQLLSMSDDALMARTNWSSAPDTLECPQSPGTPSEPSSTQYNKHPRPHRAHELVFCTGPTRVLPDSRHPERAVKHPTQQVPTPSSCAQTGPTRVPPDSRGPERAVKRLTSACLRKPSTCRTCRTGAPGRPDIERRIR